MEEFRADTQNFHLQKDILQELCKTKKLRPAKVPVVFVLSPDVNKA